MTVACAFMDSSWSARPLDPGPVGDKDSVATTSVPPSTALSNSASPFSAMNELAELAAASRRALYETRPSVADDAPAPHTMSPSRHNAGHQHVTGSRTHDARPQHTPIEDGYAPQPSAPRHHTLSRSNSQGTISSADNADLVFTPPTYGVRYSPNSGSAHSSNQENQLLRLSQIAAAQERIPEDKVDRDIGNGLLSRKRMADGMAKHTRELSNASPKEILGHSRNPSAVSVASTTGSRIGELSAELKARLSYAMVKVNHGWQSHTIDQIESLTSQATSPCSTASTIHLRNGSSSSPQLCNALYQHGSNATPATGRHPLPDRPIDSHWTDSPHSTSRGSSVSPIKSSQGLAPPVSIQPSHSFNNPRRTSNLSQPPSFLSNSHQSSPYSGSNPTNSYLTTTRQRSALSEGILVSPHTNVREQDAIESLLFMSSPGNSANLKHAFPPSSSQPLPSGHAPPQRTALPTSQPRKSLPTGRHTQHSRTQSQTQKRVGFEKSPRVIDNDDDFGSPMSVTRSTPQRKRLNGGSHGESQAQTTRLKQMPVSQGLTVSKPHPVMADEDIDRMLDEKVAAGDDSDSDAEIQIPVSRTHREGSDSVGS